MNNFIQLLRLRGDDRKGIDTWKTNKYTSPDIQNECLQLMALHILREVSQNIAGSHCFSIMADECTDCSNKEQFTINIRWVDQALNAHEEFYLVSTIDAQSLVSAIRDVLLRMNTKVDDCRVKVRTKHRIVHRKGLYHIAGNFREVKLSRFSRIIDKCPKLYPC